MNRPRPAWHPATKPSRGQIAASMHALAPSSDAEARINGALGLAPIPAAPPIGARRGTRSNRRRGTAIEGVFGGQGVTAVLHAEGYTVVRSHESRGAADVIGLRRAGDGPTARAIQAKRLAEFRPSGLNDAVARFLGIGRWVSAFQVDAGTRREAWLWVDGDGWVARVCLTDDGAIDATGPRAKEVQAALERILARPARTTATIRSTDRQRFRERLAP